MGRYRKIDPRIWNDAKFSSLSHEDQRAFLFILTHPNMTSIGALRSSVDGLGAELGREPEEFRKGFQELLAKGLIKVNQKACLIWAPNFLKYNVPENPNVVKGWLSALDFVPECPLLLEIFEKARRCADSMFDKPGKGSKPYDNPLKSVCERLSKEFAEGARKSLAIQEQEQEQDKKEKVEKETAKPKAKREPLVPFPDTLPAEWRQAALGVRSDVTPERVFLKLRGRYAATTSKKTMGNWRKIFLDWIGREYPETGKSLAAAKALPPHKDPAFRFDDAYYADALKPDGTTDWGV